jgi:hypothetical protein
MPTKNIFIARPTTTNQINALKAVVKALNVKFEIKKETSRGSEPNKMEILNSLQQGIREMKLIQEGKLKGTSLKEFLDEL